MRLGKCTLERWKLYIGDMVPSCHIPLEPLDLRLADRGVSHAKNHSAQEHTELFA